MGLDLRFQGNNHITWADAVEKLGSERAAHNAYRRGINKIGDKARTQVKRALAKQTGLKQSDLIKYGAFGESRANYSTLAYAITSKGGYVPLKAFGARQFSWGVQARPWGKSQRFKGTFIFAGTPTSGKPVAGGHVWHRRTQASRPIEKMFGPAVPVEMVKGASAKAFEDATLELGQRIAHEVRVMTDGVVTRG